MHIQTIYIASLIVIYMNFVYIYIYICVCVCVCVFCIHIGICMHIYCNIYANSCFIVYYYTLVLTVDTLPSGTPFLVDLTNLPGPEVLQA